MADDKDIEFNLIADDQNPNDDDMDVREIRRNICFD